MNLPPAIATWTLARTLIRRLISHSMEPNAEALVHVSQRQKIRARVNLNPTLEPFVLLVNSDSQSVSNNLRS
jgi:hypothetical protein